MTIEEILLLTSEYQTLQQSLKEVTQLLKDRSDLESFKIVHGDFELEVNYRYKQDVVFFLDNYKGALEARLEVIKEELGVT